jgi:hypothetical protein
MIIDEYGNRRFPGLYRGIVADNSDPLNRGRLKVRVPQVLFDATTDWCPGEFSPGAGLPTIEVGTEIWVMFEGGDPSFPVWTGTVDSVDPLFDLEFLDAGTPYSVYGGIDPVEAGAP